MNGRHERHGGQRRSVCIVGAGAIGCALAPRLTAAGNDVTLVARRERLDVLKKRGLRLDERGEVIVAEPRIAAIEELGPQSILFLAVKSHSLPEMVPDLLPLIDNRTVIIPLLNGIPWWFHSGSGFRRQEPILAVDPEARLFKTMPVNQLVGCVVYSTALLRDVGAVHVALGQHFALGAITDCGPEIEPVSAMLMHAGIKVSRPEKIRDDVWTKCSLNLSVNPLSVLSGASLGEHFTEPWLVGIVTRILDECWKVGEAYGCTPTTSTADAIALGSKPAAREHRTSMQTDYRRRRPLEISAIYTALAQLAEKIGMNLPVTTSLVDLVKFKADCSKGELH